MFRYHWIVSGRTIESLALRWDTRLWITRHMIWNSKKKTKISTFRRLAEIKHELVLKNVWESPHAWPHVLKVLCFYRYIVGTVSGPHKNNFRIRPRVYIDCQNGHPTTFRNIHPSFYEVKYLSKTSLVYMVPKTWVTWRCPHYRAMRVWVCVCVYVCDEIGDK